MAKNKTPTLFPQKVGVKTKHNRYLRCSTSFPVWQRSIRRWINRVLVRMAVLGLLPIPLVEAILGRWRND
ncbi:hypothetical protein JT06_03820 [Desulfobulbus sp. Tol-SR]|nr:hypothetical protein JT06_03820 [Desulfobulbus sp. Tol-SR]